MENIIGGQDDGEKSHVPLPRLLSTIFRSRTANTVDVDTFSFCVVSHKKKPPGVSQRLGVDVVVRPTPAFADGSTWLTGRGW
jgi:hypothetical protein